MLQLIVINFYDDEVYRYDMLFHLAPMLSY